MLIMIDSSGRWSVRVAVGCVVLHKLQLRAVTCVSSCVRLMHSVPVKPRLLGVRVMMHGFIILWHARVVPEAASCHGGMEHAMACAFSSGTWFSVCRVRSHAPRPDARWCVAVVVLMCHLKAQ